MPRVRHRIEQPDDPVRLEAPPRPKQLLTPAQQYERNMDVVADRIRSIPYAKIAKKHGLTIRRCEQIFHDWKSHNPSLREHDPILIVDELIMGYQSTIEDLAIKAADGASDMVKIRAMQAKLSAYADLTKLLQAVGVLPNDLGTMHLHIDGKITAERIIAVLERHNVPEDVFEGILDALGGPVDAMTVEHDEHPQLAPG